MKEFLKHDEWKIIEEGFHPAFNEITESIFSLGNGRMGQRGNFEEKYSGKSLQGNYIAGIYYPDKTRVGWWKNGYPEYFAKVLNATNWIGINIQIGGEILDLNNLTIDHFYRELDMQKGLLTRKFSVRMNHGAKISVESKRVNSIVDDESGVIQYSIKSENFKGQINLQPYLDGDIKNRDSNYEEKFWDGIKSFSNKNESFVWLKTRKSNFEVISGQKIKIYKNGILLDLDSKPVHLDKFSSLEYILDMEEGDTICLEKYAVNLSSENHNTENFESSLYKYLDKIGDKGAELMFEEQRAAWANKWSINDIIIEGDIAAQQGIRFNIFQLNQTYTGKDIRLNIGPKGFTGEKYGGSTYWDTEAYCVPFYLSTSPSEVTKNLLIYRWKHLEKAIENAEKLGFTNGAALYPMVTINGEECHNEWEITFEEIHRNGAIAYAIYDYVNYTNDREHLVEYGFEVLFGIARFWAQRFNFSKNKGQYVMLGVTGPNEYENNVNNNWYTNYIARWCLNYTLEVYEEILEKYPERAQEKFIKTKLSLDELIKFREIVQNIYFPESKELEIFLQQDGFLDKEILPVSELNKSDLPLNQNWSWDRILRSCYIKQADVLQGMYFFEDDFSMESLEKNFDFYEPITVHESSLSPCIHGILAAKLGRVDQSYEFYKRASRLDLDDYNNDTEDGCHITSMAGTWMSIVKGFGGMRVKNNQLVFNPVLPKNWSGYRFKINFRENLLEIQVNHLGVNIKNLKGPSIELVLHNQPVKIMSTQFADS